MISVQLVPVHMVDEVWPRIAQTIVGALKKAPSETKAGDFWVGCRSGSMFLILAFDEAEIKAVTVWRLSNNGYFECQFLSGKDAREWIKTVCDYAIATAKANGCLGIGAVGRVGFGKLLKRLYPSVEVPRQTYILRCE